MHRPYRVRDGVHTSRTTSAETSFRALCCTACGGALLFDVGPAEHGAPHQIEPRLSCPQCGAIERVMPAEGPVPRRPDPVPPEVIGAQVNLIFTGVARPAPPIVALSCPSCAAVSDHPATTISLRCGSCGGSLQRADLGGPNPPVDGMLPLQIGRDEARQRIVAGFTWRNVSPAKRKLFRDAELTLTYLPYLVHAAEVHNEYAAQRATRRHRTPNGPDTFSGWVPVAGTLQVRVDDVAWLADLAGDGAQAVHLGTRPKNPSELHEAVAFRPEYLAGCLARLPDAGCRTASVGKRARGGCSGRERHHVVCTHRR